MREIKFRGKRIDNGEWIFGSLMSHPDGTMGICVTWNEHKLLDAHAVIPETVGQSTGREDKKGVEIYSGDLTIDSKGNKEFVEEHSCAWILRSFHKRYKGWEYLADVVVEVIGNIHDNPELLENG